MPRILVFWSCPAHLSDEEASDWTRREAGRLALVEGIRRAELSRLRDASARHPRVADWMLELDAVDAAHRDAQLVDDACRDWLADLRLLGMGPAIVLAARAAVLREDGTR